MTPPFRLHIAAALIGVAGLALLLAAATQGNGSRSVPSPGGTFVEGLAGEPRYINPLLATSQPERDATSLVFAGLTRVDSRGEVVRDLASTWEISPDGITYTFHLRPNARWHDGEPVTADDVLLTTGLVQNTSFPGDPSLASLWRLVKVEKVDRDTVRFILPEPYAAFLQFTTIGLLPAHLWRDTAPGDIALSPLNSAPVGAGRFRLAAAGSAAGDAPTPAPARPRLADGLLLEPNPYYQDERPMLGRIWLRYYPGPGALLAALERGEVDGVSAIEPGKVAALAGTPGVQLQSSELQATEIIFLNLRLPLFDRRETRQALLSSLDRQALLDRAAGGQGEVAHSPLLPSSWAHDSNLPVREYDPEQARSLLDEAGWVEDGRGGRTRGGQRLEFTLAATEGDTVAEALANAAVEQWRRIGVESRVRVVPRAELLGNLLTSREFEAVLIGWRGMANDPDVYPLWHSTQAPPGAGLNFSGYSNDTVDRALELARVTLSRPARMAYYREFQRAFANDVPSILLYYPGYSYAVRERVRGLRMPAALIDPSGRFQFVSEWYIRDRPEIGPASSP